ncbi:divalent-cation tolerance protein CutA [Haloarchaeobius sp. DFWS5]|uniref:divalent-cation tolerance protein CutA n=1 Tax=Haloarchaeobius sp. DFWS5 TaxID=3446114 RepID=UPI003EBD0861
MPTVYVTAPPDSADELARTLVGERFAACVNQVHCRSTYRWDGEVHDDDEVILLVKTTDECYDSLVERIETLHPYDVPCIERFDESHVTDAFGQWRTETVREIE